MIKIIFLILTTIGIVFSNSDGKSSDYSHDHKMNPPSIVTDDGGSVDYWHDLKMNARYVPSEGSRDVCVDTDNGATDAYGDSCADYFYSPHWCGGDYDDDDFYSGDMCCACGGGNHVATVVGCTDVTATNYNPDANWDDGSCEYPCINVTVRVVTASYGGENFWYIDDGDGVVVEDGPLESNQVYEIVVCLFEGEYSLHYIDSYEDGWHGGTIEIVGIIEPIVVFGEGGVTMFSVDSADSEDCCGVEYGDGTTCDGVCGACNDDTSCLDCCGVANGDGTTCDGVCGACDEGIAEGECDCDGNTLDDCGVCNGDSMGSTDCNNNGIDDVCEDEYYLGEDAGYILGTSAGDINLDGNLNVTDIIMYIEKILRD